MKYEINLLPEKEKDLIERGVFFVLHYLRYVLVITQIVVIIVFFYRFKIDQEIVDLKDELQQKQEIVAISLPLLTDAEKIDLKTREIREILTRQALLSKTLNYFVETFPKRLTVKRLELRNGSITFEAVTTDPAITRAYFERMRKEGRFKTVTLRNIRRNGSEFFTPFVLSDFQTLTEKQNEK